MTSYINFTKAIRRTEQEPPMAGKPYPKGGDFTKFSFDPIRGQEAGYILALAQGGVAWRGTAPTSSLKLKTAALEATPYPTVTLTDCPTKPRDWTTYYIKTKKAIQTQPGTSPPPHLITADVIFYQGRWGVTKTTPDTKHTCVA